MRLLPASFTLKTTTHWVTVTAASALALLLTPGKAHAQSLDRAGLITLTDHENGNLRNEVLLRCGQAYVEIFQRKNGVQVTAQDITSSSREVGGGYCVYSLVTGGMSLYNAIETRFYSYLPGSGGVFTPGPAEQVWTTYYYGLNPIGAQSGNVQPGELLVADLGDGRARFDRFAPSGQAYVEIFGRQNGLQNLAGGVTASEVPIGNGFSRYSVTRAGYRPGASLEFRSYNYLPATPGVYFPGPDPSEWNAYTYGARAGEFFDAVDASYSLDPQQGSDVDVYFGHATSNIVRAFTGWYLDRGVLPKLTVPLKTGLNTARMAQVYVQRCDTGAWEPLSSVPAFNPYTAPELVIDGLYQYSPSVAGTQLPGQQIDPRYECEGTPITIETLVGRVTLTTRAKVHYAYVVRHFNFSR